MRPGHEVREVMHSREGLIRSVRGAADRVVHVQCTGRPLRDLHDRKDALEVRDFGASEHESRSRFHIFRLFQRKHQIGHRL